jgi:hypothetical protein
MLWRTRTHENAVSLKAYNGEPVEIELNRPVLSYMCRELRKYPDCEDGGKYIGRIERYPSKTRLIIIDFLPGGPNARRTPVEFFPDGEFQEKLFREAERMDSSIEHLGSWHSHHCNGLQTLSGGDVKGYFKTIAKRNYRPNFFVASLVRRIPENPEEDGWVSHYLFVRNDGNYYDATGQVVIPDLPNPWKSVTGHNGVSEREQTRIASSKETDTRWWYDSDVGRKTLAEHQRLFMEKFGRQFVAKRVKGQIRFVSAHARGIQITVAYPVTLGENSVDIGVGTSGREIVRLSCDVDFAPAALEGAFKIADTLGSGSDRQDSF